MPPPRYEPEPEYGFDDEPEPTTRYRPPISAGGSGLVERRVRGARWATALATLTVWTAGVARAVFWGTDYVASNGDAVGRGIGAMIAPLLAALIVAAVGGALILGRAGVWAGGIAAAIAGAAPDAVPDAIWTWSAKWTPDGLTDAFATVGALPGEYLRWVAFLGCPILVIVCLARAMNQD